MKKKSQCHFEEKPVVVLTRLGFRSVTWWKAETQQIWAFAPSYIWWNCFLISPLYRGFAT